MNALLIELADYGSREVSGQITAVTPGGSTWINFYTFN